MYDILRSAIEKKASDIHITENKIGWLRVQGTLEKFEQVVHLDEIDSFIEIEIPTMSELASEKITLFYKSKTYEIFFDKVF